MNALQRCDRDDPARTAPGVADPDYALMAFEGFFLLFFCKFLLIGRTRFSPSREFSTFLSSVWTFSKAPTEREGPAANGFGFPRPGATRGDGTAL